MFGQLHDAFGMPLGRQRRPWDGLGDFGMDRRMPVPPQAYEDYFKAYSMAMFPGRERAEVSYGGKIIMPSSALAKITDLELESPFTFELRTSNAADARRTHCGVVEFIADEGMVYLPAWMMRMLGLDEGSPIHIKGTQLPRGRFVKIQPQTTDFLEISDPKAVLEQALRNYPTLTPGDIIEISYNCLTFEILIMQIEPDAEGISIIETDLEVDFAPPKGYVEPERRARTPPPTLASRLGIDQSRHDTILPDRAGAESRTVSGDGAANPGVAAPFKGLGYTLSGKLTKGRKDKPITPRDPDSRVRRTDIPTVVTNDTVLDQVRVPAALNLPFGTLFFGYDVKRLNVGESKDEDADKEQKEEPPKFAGTGTRLGAAPPAPEIIEIDSD
ncbi:ubiquitin fusion degradation protein [Malassezia cuniculi]|uniref:Ubiquitin fusion degradation protein n=1 Tax=Malassezia cuniculi TaxID=948313 RepID=A0AAF0JBY9_9BASI|nr:ubiquitin fusion degradation protein [Malassezia cuniculi]